MKIMIMRREKVYDRIIFRHRIILVGKIRCVVKQPNQTLIGNGITPRMTNKQMVCHVIYLNFRFISL